MAPTLQEAVLTYGGTAVQDVYLGGVQVWTAQQQIVLPNIGESFQGGFFAGLLSLNGDGVATHALVVSPRSSGTSSTQAGIGTNLLWKTSNTDTPNSASFFDGRANTDAIIAAGIGDHPAAAFCVGLSIGGYSDWYLPSDTENHILRWNLARTSQSYAVGFGATNYSVPIRSSNYSTNNPAATSAPLFVGNGAEKIDSTIMWSSTTASASQVRSGYHADGSVLARNKTSTNLGLRAVRRVAL